MKAIIYFQHRRYLVPCARKALAFAEFMQKAQPFDLGADYESRHIKVTDEPVEIQVETVPVSTKIVVRKSKEKGAKS